LYLFIAKISKKARLYVSIYVYTSTSGVLRQVTRVKIDVHWKIICMDTSIDKMLV